MITKLYYSEQELPFPRIVGDMLGYHNLMLLHELDNDYVMMEAGADQDTEFHRKFYSACTEDSDFMKAYRLLVDGMHRTLMSHLDNEEYLYQRIPTFRVHLPGNKAVGGTSHRDRDYGHHPRELNFLVPLTSMIGTNSMFTETKPGRRDFQFVEANPGQVIHFDGANCEHGNFPNVTGITRVSFDFRTLRLEHAADLVGATTVTGRRKFEVGDYYASSKELTQ